MTNRSTEDYIKAVYALEAIGESVTTSAVASRPAAERAGRAHDLAVLVAWPIG